jgi:hypothetical protein
MEFRIFHSVFCSQYKIQHKALNFDVYVEQVLEKFLIDLLEIHPSSWGLICGIVLVNWARTTLNLNYANCEYDDLICREDASVRLFTITGSM